MPDAATLAAARPKCPSQLAEGPTTRRCATPMDWNDALGSWVCHRHPHMEVRPDDLERARLAPKGVRSKMFREQAAVLASERRSGQEG